MADWSQSTVQKYYEYCLNHRVIPTLDLDRCILDLVGSKDAVRLMLFVNLSTLVFSRR